MSAQVFDTQPCGCRYRQVDVPDDQGYGQGWEQIAWCDGHLTIEPEAAQPLVMVSQSGRRWVLAATSSDGHINTRADAERIAAEMGFTVENAAR